MYIYIYVCVQLIYLIKIEGSDTPLFFGGKQTIFRCKLLVSGSAKFHPKSNSASVVPVFFLFALKRMVVDLEFCSLRLLILFMQNC